MSGGWRGQERPRAGGGVESERRSPFSFGLILDSLSVSLPLSAKEKKGKKLIFDRVPFFSRAQLRRPCVVFVLIFNAWHHLVQVEASGVDFGGKCVQQQREIESEKKLFFFRRRRRWPLFARALQSLLLSPISIPASFSFRHEVASPPSLQLSLSLSPPFHIIIINENRPPPPAPRPPPPRAPPSSGPSLRLPPAARRSASRQLFLPASPRAPRAPSPSAPR